MFQVTDELTKNRREDDKANDGGFKYKRSDSMCPVKSFEFYLSKLNPHCDALFQRSKKEPAS